jgi:uncharacterized membrane protein YbhN (UPF0104 family)
VILLVYGVIAFELPESLEKWRIPAELTLAVITVLLLWFLYTARKATPTRAPEQSTAPLPIWGRVRRYLSGFATSTRSLATGPRFLGALIFSMVGWAGQLVTFVLAAEAAHVPMPYAASLAALLAVNLGLLIRATPGNVGFFQFVYALTAEQFGVPRNDAIAVSLLIQTLQIIPLTLMGVALAPEFIFKSRAKKEAESLTKNREPVLLGDSPKESEKLGGASG